MKTGFICASGFNLVATATRGGKQLIAVVLGSSSGGARAVKAAELLESGFTQNPLGWLTPALGTVDALTPINADPPNLTDQICNGHRKKPAAEDEDADAGGEGSNADTPFSAVLSSLRAPTPHGAALLNDFGAITPVVVYTGPTRTPDQVAKLAAVEEEAAVARHRKKGGSKESKTAAKEEKAADKKAADKADGKATDGEAKRKPWTPTSSSSLAASPPPELETKGADKPKKKQKAAKSDKDSAAKPTTAQ
jgi:D-alanyl-D-alanine carboxypeptidase